jgi:predicted Zn-dependent protease
MLKSLLSGLLAATALLWAAAPVQAYIPMDDHYLCDFPQPLDVYRYYRWFPQELPLRVYIPEPGFDQNPQLSYRELVSAAFMRWQQKVPTFKFVMTDRPEAADIRVVWHEHFPESESAWGKAMFPTPYRTAEGIRHRSQIHLAVRPQAGTGFANDSKALFSADELLAIATHEVGHALGLPHSRNRDDIMSSHIYRLVASYQWEITPRDVATLVRLYTLPWQLEVPPCNG